ncbi:LuxR family two component transcriptional regulator [Murinocardiopsis flavida]|uniref:LuxR family two component transcriptional regulator n=1 Tax=Murinocardiopsis flavida TaxID=645275 RepID=A0A2P8DUZ8_9ACTN|nr:response regulator transcription factor [Murinocardiopsis flavida]PSL01030.1 LuxR family two component transcriptional regulator [Murinocardiopsis flavida]
MIRLVLADDEAVVRAGVRAIVTARGGVDVVGEAADGSEAVALVAEHRPDVVLLDVRMPRCDGLAAAAILRRDFPATAVVMLTMFDEDAYVASALDDGVSGFLLKTGAPGELLLGVHAAATGGAFLSPRVARRLVDRYSGVAAGHAAARDAVASLSRRERDVLTLLAEGLTNREIADRLGLAESTVKTHVSGVHTRLGVPNRVRAALLAHEAGIVSGGR